MIDVTSQPIKDYDAACQALGRAKETHTDLVHAAKPKLKNILNATKVLEARKADYRAAYLALQTFLSDAHKP